MKRVIFTFVGIVAIGLGLWMGFYPEDWQNWLGFSKAAYFTNGQNYAFTSGPGPMLLTAAGMSTIIGGLWHTHNCHEDGCWKIGRHKVNGTPWCDMHHESARHIKTPEQLIEEQNDLLREQNDLLRKMAGVNS
jgi:hypothetical protein